MSEWRHILDFDVVTLTQYTCFTRFEEVEIRFIDVYGKFLRKLYNTIQIHV